MGIGFAAKRNVRFKETQRGTSGGSDAGIYVEDAKIQLQTCFQNLPKVNYL